MVSVSNEWAICFDLPPFQPFGEDVVNLIAAIKAEAILI